MLKTSGNTKLSLWLKSDKRSNNLCLIDVLQIYKRLSFGSDSKINDFRNALKFTLSVIKHINKISL